MRAADREIGGNLVGRDIASVRKFGKHRMGEKICVDMTSDVSRARNMDRAGTYPDDVMNSELDFMGNANRGGLPFETDSGSDESLVDRTSREDMRSDSDRTDQHLETGMTDMGRNIQEKEIELMTLSTGGAAQRGRLRLTVDSGAGESVCGPADAPDFRIRSSAEQAKGTYYLAVGPLEVPSWRTSARSTSG